MSLLCAISGTVPQEPVVSPQGIVFEKRLIENLLEKEQQICPITGEHLRKEDLISIKSPKVVRPLNIEATTIPQALDSLKAAFDSLLLTTFEARKERDAARAQLTTTLYEHDASCKVIATLLKKEEELQKELEEFKSNDTRKSA